MIPFIRAWQYELAVSAADDVAWIDVSRFLCDGPVWTREAATAVIGAQADLIPDDRIEQTAATLLDLLRTTPADAGIQALKALAALGDRLPTTVAHGLLPILRAGIEREPGHVRRADQEILAVVGAVSRHPDTTVAREATELLVEAVVVEVINAESYLRRVQPFDVERIKELAGRGNRAAVSVLSIWGQVSPVVVQAARDGADRILQHPLGFRDTVTFGGTEQDDALALWCALSAPEPNRVAASDQADTSLAVLRDRVVEHLMNWAEDSGDVAVSRASALAALRILRDRVPTDHHAALCSRLLAVADDPRLHPDDLSDQASTGPLNYWTFRTRSELLVPDALLTAAYYATTTGTATAIARRLTPQLASADAESDASELRASTLRELERLYRFPLDSIVAHPAPVIRMVAAVLWGGRSDRAPELAALFAGDPDPRVRHTIAVVVAALDVAERTAYADALAELANDPSYRVRTAAQRVFTA